MEGALGVQETIAFGMRARKLDGGFHALTARTAEEYFLQIAAPQATKLRRKFAGEFRNMALQHRRAGAVQFVFQRRQNRKVIVPGVMNAVAGEEIEDTCAFRRD